MVARRALLLLVGLLLLGALILGGQFYQSRSLPQADDSLHGQRTDAQATAARLSDEVDELARDLERAQGPGEAPPARAAQPLQPRVEATPTTAPGPAASVDAAQLERVKVATARLRQLQPKAAVETEFLNQQQLQQFMVQLLDREYLPTERDSDQRLLVALGFLEEQQQVVQEWLALYTEQVVGLYDSDTKKQYVVADAPRFGPEEQVTFAHEYVHALQDQYFHLDDLSPKHPENQDQARAVDALIEGDATLSMALYATHQLPREELAQLGQSSPSARLAQAPLLLRSELLFPYTEGLRFVQGLYQRGGFGAINQAFADPPQSTEQVLHPEKYERREPPMPVELPDLSLVAGEGWQRLSSNILGELYLQVLIEQDSDAPTAQRAAAGWGGDRWQLLTRGDETALVLRTTWDSARDAQEFLSAYADALQGRFQDRGQVQRTPDHVHLAASGYWIDVRLQGQGLDVLIAPDGETGQRLSDWLAEHRE